MKTIYRCAAYLLGAYSMNSAVAQGAVSQDRALSAFEVVRSVLQHPRCQNCHIPGDAPLQHDEGRTHDMYVKRGPAGFGASNVPLTSQCSCQRSSISLASAAV